MDETSKQLKEFYRLMMEINPNASMNIFFHQSDLDFYNEEKANEPMRLLMEAVESIRDPTMETSKHSGIAGYSTSIYDASINESNFFYHKNLFFNNKNLFLTIKIYFLIIKTYFLTIK